jgi:protein dithiol:quinone oxidoreductase
MIYSIITLIISLAGLGTAGRQVYLQHLPPDQVPSCGVGLNYMLQCLPINEVIKRVFEGSAECAQIHWSFLSLSMAEWSLVTFGFFSLVSLILVVKTLFKK